jgi:hypothetical protein
MDFELLLKTDIQPHQITFFPIQTINPNNDVSSDSGH